MYCRIPIVRFNSHEEPKAGGERMTTGRHLETRRTGCRRLVEPSSLLLQNGSLAESVPRLSVRSAESIQALASLVGRLESVFRSLAAFWQHLHVPSIERPSAKSHLPIERRIALSRSPAGCRQPNPTESHEIRVASQTLRFESPFSASLLWRHCRRTSLWVFLRSTNRRAVIAIALAAIRRAIATSAC